jgi:hypothetical protein
MAKVPHIHVVARNEGWVVRKEGATRASSVHSTQRDAVDAARKIARHENGELVIHGRDGRIRDRDSYGNDPFAPRERTVLFPDRSRSVREKAIKKAVTEVIRESNGNTTRSSGSSKR